MQHTEVTIFKQLLAADVVRGRHATGMACVDEKYGDVSVYKRAVPAHDFLDMGRMTRDLTVFQRALLGHNRHATQGASSSHDGAHPFVHGDVTLMHNGSLRSRRGLIDSKDFVVDSENICHTFAYEDFMDVIPKLDGAFCLIWHDARDGCIRFVRNTERPLTFALEQTKTQTNYYYASEPEMLSWVLGRNNTTAEFHELKPGVVVTIDPDMKVSMDKVELYTAPKPQYPAQYGGGPSYRRSYQPPTALDDLNLTKGQEVEVEFTQSTVAHTPHGAPKRYNWSGTMVDDPSVIVRCFGQDTINSSELYLATVGSAYITVGNQYNMNVTCPMPLPEGQPECELCNEKIESNQSFVSTEFGKMHSECYEFFMKEDSLKEGEG